MNEPDELSAWPLQERFERRRVKAPAEHGSRLKALWQPAAQLAALIILVNCSAVPPENVAEPSLPPNYGVLVSDALKKFKDFAGYSNFEVSDLRWVHAPTGWDWLVCVRYDDHGHRRIYTFFIKDNVVVNSRYDIVTDQCGIQNYVPLDVTTGKIGAPTPVQQPPLY